MQHDPAHNREDTTVTLPQTAIDALEQWKKDAEDSAFKSGHDIGYRNGFADGVASVQVPPSEPDPTPDPARPLLLVGRSSSNYDHGPLKNADVLRVYNFGAVDGEMAASPRTKVLLLSDDPGNPQGATLEGRLRGVLSKYVGLDLIVWLPENEVTARSHSTASAQAYVAKTKAAREVTDKIDKAITSINVTTYGVKVDRHKPLFDAGVAQYLEAITSSCYNPGRDKSPPVWDSFTYLDKVLDLLVEYEIDDFGVGEFGNPVDPRDPNKRPDYDGDFLEYIDAGCTRRGKRFRWASYWDSWKNEDPSNPDNRLQNDNPRTAQAIINRAAAINAAH